MGWKSRTIAIALLSLSPGTMLAAAGPSGSTLKIHRGIVVAAQQVKLDDANPLPGILVGGTLGRVSASGRSSSTKARNTMIGVMAGGMLSVAGKDSRGMQYTVRALGGSDLVILTNQMEIRVGDCVVVEESKKSANIRREPDSVCGFDDLGAWEEVEEELMEEARECQAAKDQLLAARSDAEEARALRIMAVLCDS